MGIKKFNFERNNYCQKELVSFVMHVKIKENIFKVIKVLNYF